MGGPDIFRAWNSFVLTALAVLSVAVTGAATQPPHRAGSDERLFSLRTATDELAIVDWSRTAVRTAAGRPGHRQVARLPLRSDLTVDVEIEPFSVTGPETRFVLGHKGRPDEPLDFDPSSISLFTGRVVGRPGSRVFLAFSEALSTGYVDLGPGLERYRIASAGETGAQLPPGRVSVFETGPPPGFPPGVPECGVVESMAAETSLPAVVESTGPLKGLKHLQLAVETDHEFFTLFGDVTAAMTYVMAMYAQVSDIYARDVDTWIELSFVRIWDDPNDLFNDVDPSPLGDFRNYWNANMGGVTRDVAQLFSGRRDYPFGGQAYLSEFCTTNAYSVVGYASGFFPDPSTPSPYNYDISVTAHEIGHNAGAPHTHSEGIDSCQDPLTTPQRGTIMSYCGQTWSGGNSNRDSYFHSTIQSLMDSYINSVPSCVVSDCNRNGIDDTSDIQQSASTDANTNGIPDECEDCNVNLVLDDVDIASMTSTDFDGNGVPDECEPDCNVNGIPDAKDIADGTSTDAYGDDVPDECEADCDTDTVSDYTQIQANMSIDVDRNRVLDTCQDCDTNGTSDLRDLAGSHHAWVASGEPSASLREFHPSTGVLTRTSSGGAEGLTDEGRDVVVAPSGNVLVTSGVDHRVLEFDSGGTYLGNLVGPMGGGLSSPTGLIVAPDDTTLLVSSSATNEVLAYDVGTGASLGAFVSAGSGGLSGPFGLIYGPNGNLFVTDDDNEVLEYDGQTGLFLGVFVAAAANGGLDQPRGVAFKPDGNLLVASFGTNELLEFDSQNGASLGKWAQVGTATRLTQISPWGVRVGPNGNVFMTRTGEDHGSGSSAEQDHDDGALHLTNAQIYEFDARNGNFIRTYIGGNDHGLHFPTGFAFVSGWDIDCNLNDVLDSCDIAQGFSEDLDFSGIPDECEIDCNGNGTLDRLDVIPYGSGLDCNNNLSPDDCDISGGASVDCNLNGVPDECEDGMVQCCQPPGEVTGLSVEKTALTRLSWAGQGAGHVYDVVSGDVSTLRSMGHAGDATCQLDDSPAVTWDDPRSAPASGEVYYYLVRSEECAPGSYGQATSGAERLPLADCL